jgi:hypothetical protein
MSFTALTRAFFLTLLAVSSAFAEQSVSLETGWNLVGVRNANTAAATLNSFYSPVGYKTTTYSAQDASTILYPNSGYWMNSSTGDDLSLAGDEVGFNYCTLQAGWNLTTSGASTSAADFVTTVTAKRPTLTVDRLLAWDGSQWKAHFGRNGKGDLSELSSDRGFFVNLTTVANATETTACITSSSEKFVLSSEPTVVEAGNHQFSVVVNDDSISSVVVKDSAGATVATLNVANGWSAAIAAAYAESDNGDMNYTATAYTADSGVVDTTNVTVAVNIPSSARPVTPRLFAYGQSIGSTATRSVQGVEVYSVAADGSDEALLGTIPSSSQGLELTTEMSTEDLLRFKLDGYLTSDAMASEEVYVVLQQESTAETLFPATDTSGAGRPLNRRTPLARELEASPAARAPSSARNNFSAGLLFAAGRGNPGSSIRITLNPMDRLDSIADYSGLEQEVKTYDESQGMTGEWSMRVIGGARLNVTDMNTGDPLTLAERASSSEKTTPFSGITPYISSAIGGNMNEYKALYSSEKLYLGSLPGGKKIALRAYAHTDQGWKLIDSAVRGIDPSLTAGSVLEPAAASDGVYSYSNAENQTVRHVFPRSSNTFILATKDLDTLMISGNSERGGLFDYVFVASETEAVTATVRVQVVDDKTDAVVSGAMVSLEGGTNGLTDAEGRIVFDKVAMPVTSSVLNMNALRSDYLRTVISIDVNDLIANPDQEYVIKVDNTNFSSVGGTVLSGSVNDTTPVSGAIVTLRAPTVLSSMAVNTDQTGMQAYKDSSVGYDWQIRKAETVRQAARGMGLRRVLESSADFETIKSLTGSNGGEQLSYTDVLQKLVTLEEGEGESDPYHVMGRFDIKLIAKHDVNQDGTVDYAEESPDGTALEIGINPDIFSEKLISSESVADRFSSSVVTAVMQGSSTEPTNALFGGKDLDFYMLFFDIKRIATNLNPVLQWGVDIRWNSSNGNAKKQLLATDSGGYDWETVASFGDSNMTKNLTGNGMFIGWKQIRDALSDPALFKKLIETSSDNRPYLDGDGTGSHGGLEVVLRALVYNGGDTAATADDNQSVAFNVTASYATNALSVIRVVDANVVAGTQQTEFSVTTGSDGRYYFADIPVELGELAEGSSSSLLRIAAKKVGYRPTALQTVPNFTQTDVSVLEVNLEQEVMRTVALQVRSAGAAVAGAKVVLGDADEVVTDSDGNATIAVPVGSYELFVWPAEDANLLNHSQTLQVLPVIGDSVDLSVSVNLMPSSGDTVWSSPFTPLVNFTISDMTEQGSLLVEGVVEEFKISQGTGEWEIVPYGMADDVGRIRDAVSLALNGNRIHLTLNSDSEFRQTVSLEPGLNLLNVVATNSEGVAEGQELEIESGISVGSVGGTIYLPDGSTPAAGAKLVVIDGRGNLQEFTAANDGTFRATDLMVDELAFIEASLESNGSHYALTAPLRFQVGASSTTTIMLESVTSISNESPVVALDSFNVDNRGRLQFSGRIDKYDGNVNSNGRAIYSVVDGEVSRVDISSTATDAGVWSFNGNSYVGDGSRFSLYVVNLNGSHAQTPLIFADMEVDAASLMNLTINLTGLDEGEEFELWLYDSRGEIVDVVWDVMDGSTASIAMEELPAGEYRYDLIPMGGVTNSGEFSVNNATVEAGVSIAAATTNFNIHDFYMDSLRVNRLGTTHIASVEGVVRYYIPWYMSADDVTPDLILDIQRMGGETLSVAMDSAAVTFDDMSYSFIIPFEQSFELDNGNNQFVATVHALGGDISRSTNYEFTDGDQSENYAEGMGISLEWETGRDLDLHTYYYPNWSAFSGTQMANSQRGTTSTVTDGMVRAETSVSQSQSTVPAGYSIRVYVDTSENGGTALTETAEGEVMLYASMFSYRDVEVSVNAIYAEQRVVLELTQGGDGSTAVIDIPQIDQVGASNAFGYYDDFESVGDFIFTAGSTNPTSGLVEITGSEHLRYVEYDNAMYTLKVYAQNAVDIEEFELAAANFGSYNAAADSVTLYAETDMNHVIVELSSAYAAQKAVLELTRIYDGAKSYLTVDELDRSGGFNGVGVADDWGPLGHFEFSSNDQLRGGYDMQYQHIYHGKMNYQIANEADRPRAYQQLTELVEGDNGSMRFAFDNSQIPTRQLYRVEEANFEMPVGFELNLFTSTMVDTYAYTTTDRVEFAAVLPGGNTISVTLSGNYAGATIVGELVKSGYKIQSLDYTGDPSTETDSNAITMEHQRWATARGKVADGTYLVIVENSGEATGAMVKVNGPGINGVDAGRYSFGEGASAHSPQPALFIQVENNQIVRVEAVIEGTPFPLEVQNVTNNPYTVVDAPASATDTGSSSGVTEEEWFMTPDGQPLFKMIPQGYSMKLYVNSLIPPMTGMPPIYIDAQKDAPYDVHIQVPGEYGGEKLVLEMTRTRDQRRSYITIDALDYAGGSNAQGYDDDYQVVETFVAASDQTAINGMVELRSQMGESTSVTISDNVTVAGEVPQSRAASFRFIANSSGYYNIFTTGPMDTIGKLSGNDGSVDFTDENDDGGENTNFDLSRNLIAGNAYTVEVRGFSGSAGTFTLVVQPPMATATVSDDGVALVDDLGGSGSRYAEPVAGRIDAAGERDVYEFQASFSGEFELFTIGSTDTFGELYAGHVSASGADSQSLIAMNDDGGESSNFRIIKELTQGQTYSLHITGYGGTATGDYGMLIVAPQDYMSTTSTATTLNTTGIHSAAFTAQQQDQFYTYTAESGGLYTIYTMGELDTNGIITDSNGMELNQPGVDDQAGSGNNFSSTLYLTQGQRIHLRIAEFSGSEGEYRLVIESQSMVDTSTLTTVDGVIAMDSDRFTLNGSIEGQAEEDNYTFIATMSGPYEIFTTGSMDTSGMIKINNGSEEFNDDGGENTNFRHNPYLMTGDVVMITVTGYGGHTTGSYILEVKPEVQSIVSGNTEVVNNDQLRTYGSIGVGESYHTINTPGESILFYFSPPETGKYEITTYGELDTVGVIRDAGPNGLNAGIGEGTILNDPEGDSYRGGMQNFRSEVELSNYMDSNGDYQITVSSNYGMTGSFWMNINPVDSSGPSITDDHGDMPATATPVSVGTTGVGRFEYSGDFDLFKIEVSTDGTLSVNNWQSPTNSAPLVGMLFDQSMMELVYSEGGTGNTMAFEYGVSAGTYYIGVVPYMSDNTGSYELDIQLLDDTDDHGNDAASATSIAPNALATGHIDRDDHDWFTITLSSTGNLTIETTGSLDTFGKLEDEHGMLLASDDDSGETANFSITQELSAGTYYVYLRGYSPAAEGDYTLQTTFTATSAADDDYGDSMSNAYAWSVGTEPTSLPGSIESEGDTDWFSFTLTQSGYATFQSIGSMDSYGSLLDSSGLELLTNDDGGDGGNFKLEQALNPGTYYLKVRNFSPSGMGEYQLEGSFFASSNDDHCNELNCATEIAITTVGGAATGSIEQGGDEDLFRVEVSTAGYWSIATTGNMDSYGYLLDSGGAELQRNDDSGGPNFGMMSWLDTGTYYVRVRNYDMNNGTGDYTITVTETEDPYAYDSTGPDGYADDPYYNGPI